MNVRIRTLITAGLALAFAGVLATGCAPGEAHEDGARGALTVGLSVEAQKTLWPAGWVAAIGTYHVNVYAVGADPATATPLYQAIVNVPDVVDKVTIDDVLEGTYLVTVSGLCGAAQANCTAAARIAYGAAPEAVVVTRGATTDVTVTVTPYMDAAAPGALEISLEWPEMVDLTVARVEVFVKAVVGEWPATPAQAFTGADLLDFDVLFALASAPAGSHMVLFKLFDTEGNLVSTAIEVANVYSNYKTVGAIVLVADDFALIEPPLPESYDLTLEFLWAGGAGETLYFPHTQNWDPSTAPSYFLDPTATEWVTTITDATDEDGIVEFQVLQGARDWANCWNFGAWTLVNATLAADGNTCQVVVDCSATVDLLGIHVTIEPGAVTGEGTLTAVCVVEEVPDPTGAIGVAITPVDPAPAADLVLTCARTADGDLGCQVSGTFTAGATFAWYVNGIREVGLAGAAVLFADMMAGDRIVVVVQDGARAQSAQLTVTQAMLDEIPDEPVAFIAFDFSTSSLAATVGTSTLSRSPGYAGTYTYNVAERSVSTNAWDGGVGTKYWQITFSAEGYENLVLFSQQKASNTGPRDFQVQVQVDGGEWTNVGDLVVLANDAYVSGVVDGLALPAICDDAASVSVRWVVASDVSVGGATVASTGTSRIRDITVAGTMITP